MGPRRGPVQNRHAPETRPQIILSNMTLRKYGADAAVYCQLGCEIDASGKSRAYRIIAKAVERWPEKGRGHFNSWVPRPSYQLTLRTPIYAVRN
jgi:hypothetical protein